MKGTVKLNTKSLTKLLKPTHDFPCSGATGDSSPITAFIQINEMPKVGEKSGHTEVLCPRLQEYWHYVKCYEADPASIPTDFDQEFQDNFKNLPKCPYLRMKH